MTCWSSNIRCNKWTSPSSKGLHLSSSGVKTCYYKIPLNPVINSELPVALPLRHRAPLVIYCSYFHFILNFAVGLWFLQVLLKIASRRVDGSSEAASGDIRLQVCGSQQLYVIWPISRFLAFFPPAATPNPAGPNTLPQHLRTQRRAGQPAWRTVTGVSDTRRSAVSDRGAFQQICRPSDAPPRAPTSFGTRRTRRKPVRREARAHSYLFPSAPLTWFSLSLSLVISLSFARPSVASLPVFAQGWLKRHFLHPAPLHLDACLGRKEAGTRRGGKRFDRRGDDD